MSVTVPMLGCSLEGFKNPTKLYIQTKGSKVMIILINGKPTLFIDHDNLSDGLGGRHGGHGNSDEDYN